MITGIIVALPEELGTLTPVKARQGDIIALDHDILLMLAGTGPENAAKAARRLIEQGAQKLISWGCAAALAEHLKPGDLILAETLVSADQTRLHCDKQWLNHARQLLQDFSPQLDKLAESRHIVASKTAKQRLFQHTRALAVDMESAAIARIADQHDLPFLVIRSIADDASMSLPKAVDHALNSQSTVEIARLLRYLLLHPGELPALIRLGLAFSAARKTLTAIARQLDKIVDFESQNAQTNLP